MCPSHWNRNWIGTKNGEQSHLFLGAIETDKKKAGQSKLSENTRQKKTRTQESFSKVWRTKDPSPLSLLFPKQVLKIRTSKGIRKGWSVLPFQNLDGSDPRCPMFSLNDNLTYNLWLPVINGLTQSLKHSRLCTGKGLNVLTEINAPRRTNYRAPHVKVTSTWRNLIILILGEVKPAQKDRTDAKRCDLPFSKIIYGTHHRGPLFITVKDSMVELSKRHHSTRLDLKKNDRLLSTRTPEWIPQLELILY